MLDFGEVYLGRVIFYRSLFRGKAHLCLLYPRCPGQTLLDGGSTGSAGHAGYVDMRPLHFIGMWFLSHNSLTKPLLVSFSRCPMLGARTNPS
ncbi:hypothetical protein ES707_20629 [subsurface metagenome]